MSNDIPKPLRDLLKLLEKGGHDVSIHAVDVTALSRILAGSDPSEPIRNGMHPRVYYAIMARHEDFSEAERAVVRLVFHRESTGTFEDLLVKAAVAANEYERERLRACFPELIDVADIIRDPDGRLRSLVRKTMALQRELDAAMKSAGE